MIATAHLHDVGQGQCATIVDAAGSDAMVIDCGYGSEIAVATAVESRAVRTLLVTHLDMDHCGDLMKLVRRFNPDVVRLNLDTAWRTDAEHRKLLALLRGLKDWAAEVGSGDLRPATPTDLRSERSIPGVSWTILAPTQGELIHAHAIQDRNSASVIVRVEVDGAAILFTGDTNDQVLDRIANADSSALSADVLVVPHHGGAWQSAPARLSLPDLYDLVRPDVAFFSVGIANSYNHPRLDSIREPASRQGVRVMCSQVTSTCHSRDAASGAECAGTVSIAFHGHGKMTIEPEIPDHAQRILGWSRPRCVPFVSLDP